MPRSIAACYMKVFYKGMKFVSFATWYFVNDMAYSFDGYIISLATVIL